MLSDHSIHFYDCSRSESFSFKKFEQIQNDNSFGLNFNYMPKLTYSNIHYRCPKCYNFPMINIVDRENIIYECGCPDRKKKSLKIKDLFNKENKYMTFLNDSKQNISEEDKIEKINENIGFKCTSHDSKENNEFRYYCLKCNENICKECISNHIKKEKDCFFLHDIIILDFQNILILQKLS